MHHGQMSSAASTGKPQIDRAVMKCETCWPFRPGHLYHPLPHLVPRQCLSTLPGINVETPNTTELEYLDLILARCAKFPRGLAGPVVEGGVMLVSSNWCHAIVTLVGSPSPSCHPPHLHSSSLDSRKIWKGRPTITSLLLMVPACCTI